jgi:hypothetical protein
MWLAKPAYRDELDSNEEWSGRKPRDIRSHLTDL